MSGGKPEVISDGRALLFGLAIYVLSVLVNLPKNL
jgi:hypothetical protein